MSEENNDTQTISRDDAIAKAFPNHEEVEKQPDSDEPISRDLPKEEDKFTQEQPKETEPQEKQTEEKPDEKAADEQPKKNSLMDRFKKKNETKEEKADEKPSEEAEEWKEPENVSEQQKLDWKKLKAKRDEEITARDTQIQELKAKLEQSSEQSNDPLIDDLKKQVADLTNRLSEVDFQSTPEFEDKFVKPREAAVQKVKNLAQQMGMSTDIDQLLAKTGRELGDAVSEAAESLPEFYKADFIDGVKAISNIDMARSDALQNADAYRESIHAQRRQHQEKAADAVWENLSNENDFLLEPMEAGEENAEAYNQGLESIRGEVRKYTSGAMTEESIALVSTKAAMFDFFMKHGMGRMESEWTELTNLNSAQAAKLAELAEENPTTRTPNGSVEEKGDISREEAVARAFPKNE